MKIKLLLYLFVCLTNDISFAQEIDTTTLNRHEIGATLQYGDARFHPGIQYVYNLNPKNSLVFDVRVGFSRLNENSAITQPGVSFGYKWKWELFGGLNLFTSPTISYDLLNIPSQGRFDRIGIGTQTGFEFDFNRYKIPLVAGFGVNTMFVSGLGRIKFETSTAVKLRFAL